MDRRGALALGVNLFAAACARGSAHDRLAWWAMGQQGEYAPLLTPGFERETGIGVDVQAIPWTAAHQKLVTAFVGGALPDVMMLPNRWLPEMAMLDALATRPAEPPRLAAEHELAGAAGMARVGGRDVAAPWSIGGWAQFYRPDILARAGFAEPPPDWAGWMRMARAVKRRNPDGFVTLHLLDWPEPLMNFAAQTGEPMLRDRNTRGAFDSPGFRAALAYYKGIYDEGLAPRAVGAEVGDSLVAFRRGWIAALPTTAATIGDLRRRTSWFPPDLWRVARVQGPSGPAPGFAEGLTLAVSAQARRPAQAARLVEYLRRPETQLRLFEVTGDLPVSRRAWTSPVLAHDQAAATFAAQAADDVIAPAVPEWERIRSEVQVVAEALVRGLTGLDDAVAEMNRRADRLLSKRRWMLDKGLIR